MTLVAPSRNYPSHPLVPENAWSPVLTGREEPGYIVMKITDMEPETACNKSRRNQN